MFNFKFEKNKTIETSNVISFYVIMWTSFCSGIILNSYLISKNYFFESFDQCFAFLSKSKSIRASKMLSSNLYCCPFVPFYT